MNLFFLFLTSVISAIGIAVVLVEKRFDWPVRPLNVRLRLLLRRIHPLMRRMPQCVVCAAFWTALVSDVFVCIASHGAYWFWPMSGFAAAGMAWFGLEAINVIEELVPKPPVTTTPIPTEQDFEAAHQEVEEVHENQ